jgi:hypothetical protein
VSRPRRGLRAVAPMIDRLAACGAAWCVVLGSGLARAEAPGTRSSSVAPPLTATATTPPPSTEVSAAERAAIEAAFGAGPPAADPAPAAPASGGGFARGLMSAVQSMNPDLSVILDAALAVFSSDDPDPRGAHDPSKTGFNLQQLELSIGASVDPFLRFDANIVFAQFGVEVEEAYASSLQLPWGLQARAGQFLTRFGRLNPTHPHSWDFVDQPLVLGKMFGGEGSRGLGVEASWLAPTPWYLELIVSTTDAAGECCARSFLGGRDLGVRGLEDVLVTTALKQFFPFDDDWSLFWGVSTQHGPNPSGNSNRSEIYGTDLYLRYRPVDSPNRAHLSLQLEALLRARQRARASALVDAGGYAQLVWRPLLRWETSARFEHVTGVADDPLDPEWTGARQRAALALTFYPSHFSRLRVQGAWDRSAWLDAPVWSAVLALEVLTGEHGSHDF